VQTLPTEKALYDNTRPAIHMRKGWKDTTPAALQLLAHAFHGIRPTHPYDLVEGECK